MATFAVAVPDMARAAADLRARGMVVGEPEPGRRVRPDGSELRWQTAALLAGPEWRPFLIQWEQPDPERPAGLRARGADAAHPLGEVHMRHIVIASRDPAGDARWCARLTGHPARREGAGWRVPLAGCDMVLVAAADAGAPAQEAPRITRLVLAGPVARLRDRAAGSPRFARVSLADGLMPRPGSGWARGGRSIGGTARAGSARVDQMGEMEDLLGARPATLGTRSLLTKWKSNTGLDPAAVEAPSR